MSYLRAQSPALLVGVTILSAVSATEASAATSSQTLPYLADTYNFLADTLNFDAFNTSLGTLTGVTFDIEGYIINRESVVPPTGMVTLDSTILYQVTGAIGGFPVSDTFDGTASGQVPFSVFEGPGAVSVVIAVTSDDNRERDFDFAGGIGRGGDIGAPGGLTLTYTYDPSGVSAVPLPATAWLFGFGVAGLAAISRRKRQAA